MDTIMQVRPSEKKVLFGEGRLLPADTIVEPGLRISDDPFLRGQRSQYGWHFNVGFELRLLHPNFETGVQMFSSWLFSVGLFGFGEPEEHFSAFLPVEGWSVPPQMVAVKQAIKETRLLFEGFVVDEYVRGEVSFERLRTFFVKHYRNPFGPAPRKRARS